MASPLTIIFNRLTIVQKHIEQIEFHLSSSSAFNTIQNIANPRFNSATLRINAADAMLVDVKNQLRNLSAQVEIMKRRIRSMAQHNERTAVSSPTQPDELH